MDTYYPAGSTNPAFDHEWVKYAGEKTPFDRAVWMLCKRCGRTMRSDGAVESCTAPEVKPA